jgi:hypothetical protein
MISKAKERAVATALGMGRYVGSPAWDQDRKDLQALRVELRQMRSKHLVDEQPLINAIAKQEELIRNEGES